MTISPVDLRDPVDVHIAARLRARRQELHISQGKLGVVYGVSYQQTQKHETGANRLLASQLWLIAQALGVPIDYFFEGLGAP
jgi:transcriptional regulator with XRE-family HTH domain